MTYLITGGAGFIGCNFIRYMREHYPDTRIVCVDSLTYAGNLSSLSSFFGLDSFRFERLSVVDRDGIDKLFYEERPDYVVHFAAESHVDRSIKDPGLFLKTNILGTQTLLDSSLKYGVRRYHQVSTDEVYGDLPIDRPELKFTEQSPIRTSSPYSASKASADLIVLAYARTYGLPVSISRCSNNYGPFQFPEKFIPLMIINALHNEPLPVYGTGVNIRDWLYVDDHCRAIDLILHNSENGCVYNIGGNYEQHNIDIVHLILRELGKPDSLIRFVKDRAGHDLRYAIDSGKLKNDLGWEPNTSFESGIKNTISWYCENEDWWQQILNGAYRDYYKAMYSDRF